MTSLDQQHPDVTREFHKGNFIFHMSRREFYALAIDQAYEHNNTVIKDDRGAIELREDESALHGWIVAGPKVSDLVVRYEAMSGMKDTMIRH